MSKARVGVRKTLRARLSRIAPIVSVGVAILVLALVSGCAGQAGQTATDHSPLDPVGKFLGLDGIANKRSSELARGQRIQLCMKRLGFVYVPFATAVAVKMADGGYAANLRENGYGIADAMELAIPRIQTTSWSKLCPQQTEPPTQSPLTAKRPMACDQLAVN
jgi:hypothetical protein